MLQCIGNCSDKEQPGPWEQNPNAEVAQQLEHVNEAVPVPLSSAQCAKLQDTSEFLVQHLMRQAKKECTVKNFKNISYFNI